MKKALLAGLAVLAFASFAEAGSCVRPYVSAKATVSRLTMDGKDITNDWNRIAKKDWVGGGSAAVGVKMCAFRTELEYNQSLKATNKLRLPAEGRYIESKQSYRSYMLNGYFDIPTYTPVRPYVGAGIGIARVRTSVANNQHRDNNLAWQLAAGIGYSFNEHWTLDLGYRYVNNGTSVWSTPAVPGTLGAGNMYKYHSKEHQATAGIRYTF